MKTIISLRKGAAYATAAALGMSLALAQVTPTPAPTTPGGGVPTTPNEIVKLLEGLANWFLFALSILAGFFILFAAWQYLSSGGNDEKVKSAKNYLIYAVVAIIVGLLARGIPFVVSNLIGVKFTQ